MKRLIYFFYNLLKTDFRKLIRFIAFASEESGKSEFILVVDAVFSCFKYNISISDYFYLRFYLLKDKERKKWAGTGFMFEYQLKMNPKKSRHLLQNKIYFLNHFKEYIRRRFADIKTFRSDNSLANELLSNKSGKLVLKGSTGQVGANVEIIDIKDSTFENIIKTMLKKKYDLVEEYVIQHPDLMELSPSGLNTVRIITQLNKGKVDFLGARLRISVNSHVDNMAAGNLAAPINIKTGIVEGPGVYSDITKKEESIHPVTGKKIEGFQIPFWKDTIKMVTSAALYSQENKSVGWDIAITEEGPELIEGNHNWCKLLWQLPVKQGLKHVLERYL